MPDTYTQLVNSSIGKFVSTRVGLPQPTVLQRYRPGAPVIDGPVLFGAAPGGRLAPEVTRILQAIGAMTYTPLDDKLRSAAAKVNLDARIFNPDAPSQETFKALVFDATGIATSEQLEEAYRFFHSVSRRVRPSGRIVVLGATPGSGRNPRQALAQRALEGLTRSLGKEVGHGATTQLVYLTPKAERQLESTLRFLLSPRSAYVSGQVIRIGAAPAGAAPSDWARPLAEKVALVTGASRGIGRAIAEVLARDGAHVVCLDVAGQAEELARVAADVGGSELALDITAQDAPQRIAEQLTAQHGGVDIVVHNAGVTRDKTIGRMTPEQWDTVIGVNLVAQERINAALLDAETINENGRIVSVSSMNGIAGAAGQTNYATSKAGIIGLVEAYAPPLGKTGRTINAVAPGFIETAMTAAMPLAPREAGRRMNSLSQGGLPVDVAETIAWLAHPASAGVNGNVVRVCGQSLLGA